MEYKPNISLLLIGVLYLIFTAYWLQYASEPNSDGAAYLDMARNIILRGVFRSNMRFSWNDYANIQWQLGGDYFTHPFGIYNIALFFLIGDISLLSAQLCSIFTGFLMIMTLYAMLERMFDRRVAFLAIVLACIHPEIPAHITLVGVVEVTGALYLLLSMYLTSRLVFDTPGPSEDRKIWFSTLAGFSMFAMFYSWYFNLFIYLSILPITILLMSITKIRFLFVNFFIISFLILFFIFDWRFLSLYSILYLRFPLIFSLLVYALTILIYRKLWKKHNYYVIELLIFIIPLIVHLSVFNNHPLMLEFNSQQSIVTSNVEKMKKIIFSRIYNPNYIQVYWEMYITGVRKYLGDAILILSLLALFQVHKARKVVFLSLYPLLYVFFWLFYVEIDAFQPRFIFAFSLFCFALSAINLVSLLDNILSYITHASCFMIDIRIKVRNKTIKLIKVTPAFLISFISLLSFLLVLTTIFIHPLYADYRQVLYSWQYKRIFNWEPAIQWIKTNTSPDEVFLTRSANYLSWYCDRIMVFLPPYTNITFNDVIDIAKKYNVSYFFVDLRTYWLYPNLRQFYKQSMPLPLNVTFISIINDTKVIIYDLRQYAKN
ncbi:MAG: hypothetical protein QW738_07390 [Nitrososphaeria archaeon]